MPYTALQVINLGLGKIAASRISTISPPRSKLEIHIADGYSTWRDEELVLHRWVFALEYAVLVLASASIDVPDDGRAYKYYIPNDCLRPQREKSSAWEQRGQFIYSSQATLTIPYTRRATEDQFPAEFANVLACRVAKECVEYATQSNTKEESAEAKYDKAVRQAARMNAFVLGPEDNTTNDEDSAWIRGRLYPEMGGQ